MSLKFGGSSCVRAYGYYLVVNAVCLSSGRPFHPGVPSIQASLSSGRPFHPGVPYIRTPLLSGRAFHPGVPFIRASLPSGRPFHPDVPFIRTSLPSGRAFHPDISFTPFNRQLRAAFIVDHSFDSQSEKSYNFSFRCHALRLSLLADKRYIMPFGAMHAGSSLLTGGQQRGVLCLSVLCMLAHLFWLVSTKVYYAFRCYVLWLISFDRWSAKRYTMPFDAMHDGSSLLARQYKGILCLSVLCTLAHLFWPIIGIMPFGAMHAGLSLLTGGQQRVVNKEVYYAFWCYARWLISFGSSAQRYIIPFGAMHAGSSFLADNRYIMPFCAMHAGLSLLTGGQQRVYHAFRCYARWLISFGSSAQRYIMPFGAMHAGLSLLTGGRQS
nr:hypothetical protein [Tanacetum cinerariifolium]